MSAHHPLDSILPHHPLAFIPVHSFLPSPSLRCFCTQVVFIMINSSVSATSAWDRFSGTRTEVGVISRYITWIPPYSFSGRASMHLAGLHLGNPGADFKIYYAILLEVYYPGMQEQRSLLIWTEDIRPAAEERVSQRVNSSVSGPARIGLQDPDNTGYREFFAWLPGPEYVEDHVEPNTKYICIPSNETLLLTIANIGVHLCHLRWERRKRHGKMEFKEEEQLSVKNCLPIRINFICLRKHIHRPCGAGARLPSNKAFCAAPPSVANKSLAVW
ncbi:hypothetical protein B0H13DRAFT_1918991 [Mycena leptocephala]|nr:hypothetical protein B0H13DRAFT_1918991 [Mycena leptocephala]